MTLPALKTDGVDAFLNAHGGAAGEFVRFSKEAKFVVVSDNTELSEGTRLNCIFDQTQHGWIKFNGVGKPPTRHMGGMFDGYVPPPRSELGDDDPTLWDPGLDGQPQDPWLFQVSDFKIVGKVNKSGVPQQIGAGAVLDDEIPF
jgi:hypothetical protein